MVLLFSRIGLVLPIGGQHLLLLLQLHHLDALRLEQLVLLVGVLSERGLSAVHGVRQQGGERRVDGLHHGDKLRITGLSAPAHIERTPEVEREAQAVLVRPREDVGAHGGALTLRQRREKKENTTKRPKADMTWPSPFTLARKSW